MTKQQYIGYFVNDPKRYGVVEICENNKAISIEEKSNEPKSNYAVTELYFYPKCVSDLAKNIIPRDRGKCEITSLNNMNLKLDKLHVTTLGMEYSWLDTGTDELLIDVSNYIKILEEHEGIKVCCPEEIAYKNGWINKEKLI